MGSCWVGGWSCGLVEDLWGEGGFWRTAGLEPTVELCWGRGAGTMQLCVLWMPHAAAAAGAECTPEGGGMDSGLQSPVSAGSTPVL